MVFKDLDAEPIQDNKWHDLVNNPDDIPKFIAGDDWHFYSNAVLVYAEGGIYDVAVYVQNREDISRWWWFGNIYDPKGGWYTIKDKPITTEDIVAWKYIEYFRR